MCSNLAGYIRSTCTILFPWIWAGYACRKAYIVWLISGTFLNESMLSFLLAVGVMISSLMRLILCSERFERHDSICSILSAFIVSLKWLLMFWFDSTCVSASVFGCDRSDRSLFDKTTVNEVSYNRSDVYTFFTLIYLIVSTWSFDLAMFTW